MSESNWNTPDPSGPVWASQWDYYQGAAAALAEQEGVQAPPPISPERQANLKRARRFKRWSWLVGLLALIYTAAVFREPAYIALAVPLIGLTLWLKLKARRAAALSKV